MYFRINVKSLEKTRKQRQMLVCLYVNLTTADGTVLVSFY